MCPRGGCCEADDVLGGDVERTRREAFVEVVITDRLVRLTRSGAKGGMSAAAHCAASSAG